MPRRLLLSLALLLACRADPSAPVSSAAAGGAGGATATVGGSGGGDLGWPLDDELPERCAPRPPDEPGASWTGWANYQHPPLLEPGSPAYGRVWMQGATDQPGAAPDWEAELAVGPLGSLPLGEGRCWQTMAASYHADAGNDDEYRASPAPRGSGLFGLIFRYRPPGGQWRYGDRNGSDDGLQAYQTGVMVLPDESERPLVTATLNLRCRLDDWPARAPLVVAALARIDADVIAMQEDCVEDRSQAEEIAAELASYTRRGYELRRASTHLAQDRFDEGISILSANPIEATHALDLPHVHFPRKALAVDVTVRGSALRFYTAHFDYGADAKEARAASAQAIADDLPPDRAAIVAGDLNAEPDEPAIATLAGALVDLWPAANPSQGGATMPASAPERRIDYLFASPELAGALVGARLLDEHAGALWLSDHLGVAAALEP